MVAATTAGAQVAVDSAGDSSSVRVRHLGRSVFATHADTLRWMLSRKDNPQVIDTLIYVFVADSVRIIHPYQRELPRKLAEFLRNTLRVAEIDARVNTVNEIMELKRKE